MGPEKNPARVAQEKKYPNQDMESADLADEVSKVIQKLLDDGTIAKIFEKYGAPYTAPASK